MDGQLESDSGQWHKGLSQELKRRANVFVSQFSRYTPLNTPLERVLMEIRDNPALKWLGNVKSPPAKRAKDKYSQFHRDNEHNIDECFDLKEQIKNLIRQGRLQRFVMMKRPEKQDQGPQHLTNKGTD